MVDDEGCDSGWQYIRQKGCNRLHIVNLLTFDTASLSGSTSKERPPGDPRLAVGISWNLK